jgi:hypothetical protein
MIISGRTRVPFLLLALALGGLFVAGCELSPNEAYFQGYWSFANEFDNPQATEVHLLQQWWFGGGQFQYYREVWAGFPESVEGRYRILDETEDTITLELYDVHAARSALDDGSQLALVLERETDMLRINRTLYYRSGP